MRRQSADIGNEFSGEDFLAHLATHARHWRNLETSTDDEEASVSLTRLVLYIGKTLMVRSLDDKLIIHKSHYEPVSHSPGFDYVLDRREPHVREAVGVLKYVPAFNENISLDGRERGFLLRRDVRFDVEPLDQNCEPRISVEVLETK